MQPTFIRIIALVAALPWLASCASGYNYKARSAHEAYHQGRYDDALTLIEKVKPAHRDELLYLLDKGMILHGAGKYRESNKVLTEAEGLSDAFVAKSISREVAGTLWSEEAIEYAGDKHERLLIPVIRMLNYIMLDEWNEALVEVRRLIITAEKIYGAPQEFDNAFALYLSAIIWETLGQINDALISLNQMQKHEKETPYYGQDIKLIRSRLGLNPPLPPKGHLAWQTSKDYRKHKGELIVIVESGRTPVYESDYLPAGLYNVSMPTVRAYPAFLKSAQVLVDGREVGSTYPFYNIMEDIMVALKERQKRTLVRKMIKLPVQTGLYAAGLELMEEDDTESQIAGAGLALLALSMAVAEKADERSWRTLPAEFQIGRFYLSPGKHEVEIKPIGAGHIKKSEIEITGTRPAVLLLNLPQSQSFARHINYPEPDEEISEIESKESELRQKVRQNPKDGTAKIELAYIMMEGGDYDVAPLVIDGLNNGGPQDKGLPAIIIAYVVSGDYDKARPWIGKAEKNKISNAAYYSEAIDYITGEKKIFPAPPPLTAQKNPVNAFNYFCMGLIKERAKNHEEAAYNFMRAYKYGLIGEAVEKKITSNYQKTDRAFKKSLRGQEIAVEFSDLYFNYSPR